MLVRGQTHERLQLWTFASSETCGALNFSSGNWWDAFQSYYVTHGLMFQVLLLADANFRDPQGSETAKLKTWRHQCFGPVIWNDNLCWDPHSEDDVAHSNKKRLIARPETQLYKWLQPLTVIHSISSFMPTSTAISWSSQPCGSKKAEWSKLQTYQVLASSSILFLHINTSSKHAYLS